jgi:hypothetical protein
MNPFSITDKKYYNEISNHTEAETSKIVEEQGNAYPAQEGTVLPTNRIYLMRNKKLMQKILQQ